MSMIKKVLNNTILEFDGRLAETIRRGVPVFGESDDDACRRIFGGRKFTCRGYSCEKQIEWIGACDECLERIEGTKDERTDDQRLHDRLRSLGVPDASLNQSWDTWEPSISMDEAALEMSRGVARLKDWRGTPPLVVISGPSGTGKTHLAAATMRKFIKDNGSERTVKFWHEYLLVEAHKAGFNRPDLPDVLAEAINVDLLVLDDMGSVQSTEFSAGVRSGFLSQRIDRGRWTVITTNLSQSEIKNKISERIASRTMTALVINTSGIDDHRKHMASKTPGRQWIASGGAA